MASKMTARFATDENREEGGVWVDFGDDIRVKVRRFRSRKSIEVRKELDKPFADVVRRGTLPEGVAEDLLLKQMAKAIVADWEGVDLGDGEVVPCTEGNSLVALKKFPEFREAILQVSIEADNYRAKVDEDAEKNSAASLPGA
jgi:hypothetical protein